MITAALMWPAADLLSQTLSMDSKIIQTDTEDKEEDKGEGYDLKRSAQMAVYGTFVSAPIYTFWYTYLDNFSHKLFSSIPPTSGTGSTTSTSTTTTKLFSSLLKRISSASMRSWQIITFKLLTDAFIFDPVYLLVFFSTTNLIEGKSGSEIWKEIKEKLFKTYLIDITVWTPVQFLNFRYVPVLYQALVVQFGNLFWNSYLSYTQHRFIENKNDE